MIRNITKLAFLLTVLISSKSMAEVIDITQGHADPIPIAINEFAGHNHADVTHGERIVKVIKNDLHNTNLL